jgi:hypothetical protein
MNFSMAHNIDAYIGAATASDNAALTAGGTGDNTLVTGLVIDRVALGSPLSASFVARYKAVLAAAATLSLAYSIETDDNSGFSSPTVLQSATTAVIDTGAGGGSTQRGVYRIPVDFAGAEQYVRIKFTPDLSAANTDTAEVSIVAVLGGQDFLPA